MDMVTLLARGYTREQIAAIEAARQAPAKKTPAKKTATKVTEDAGPSGADE